MGPTDCMARLGCFGLVWFVTDYWQRGFDQVHNSKCIFYRIYCCFKRAVDFYLLEKGRKEMMLEFV